MASNWWLCWNTARTSITAPVSAPGAVNRVTGDSGEAVKNDRAWRSVSRMRLRHQYQQRQSIASGHLPGTTRRAEAACRHRCESRARNEIVCQSACPLPTPGALLRLSTTQVCIAPQCLPCSGHGGQEIFHHGCVIAGVIAQHGGPFAVKVNQFYCLGPALCRVGAQQASRAASLTARGRVSSQC